MSWKKIQERQIKKTDDLNRVIDRNKQYSRRNCILMHDAKESENEDTSVVVTETLNELLQEKLRDVDIIKVIRQENLKKPNNQGLSSSNLPGIALKREYLKPRKS